MLAIKNLYVNVVKFIEFGNLTYDFGVFKISVYRLGDEGNQEIDIDILTASLKVIDIHLSKQLEIIMGWNRPDIAKKYIYLQGHDSEVMKYQSM